MAFNSADISATNVAGSHTFVQNGTVIIGLQVANTSLTTSVTFSVTLRGKYILRNGEIPFGSSLSVLDGKIVANLNDVLTVTTTGQPVDVIISFLE